MLLYNIEIDLSIIPNGYFINVVWYKLSYVTKFINESSFLMYKREKKLSQVNISYINLEHLTIMLPFYDTFRNIIASIPTLWIQHWKLHIEV